MTSLARKEAVTEEHGSLSARRVLLDYAQSQLTYGLINCRLGLHMCCMPDNFSGDSSHTDETRADGLPRPMARACDDDHSSSLGIVAETGPGPAVEAGRGLLSALMDCSQESFVCADPLVLSSHARKHDRGAQR